MQQPGVHRHPISISSTLQITGAGFSLLGCTSWGERRSTAVNKRDKKKSKVADAVCLFDSYQRLSWRIAGDCRVSQRRSSMIVTSFGLENSRHSASSPHPEPVPRSPARCSCPTPESLPLIVKRLQPSLLTQNIPNPPWLVPLLVQSPTHPTLWPVTDARTFRWAWTRYDDCTFAV